MGMTIDGAIDLLDNLIGMVEDNHDSDYDAALHIAIDTMRKYQQLQADYENRLKADMVAMLTELWEEIEAIKTESDNVSIWRAYAVFTKKINELKGESND